MQDIQAGSLLKATREAKGISVETVHEATKIPMDALKAIEEGYTVRRISPFYLKGFMKMYAEYLSVNVKDISPEADSKKKQSVRPVLSPAQEFDLEQWMSKTFTRRRKQQIVVVAGILLCFFILFKIITFFTHQGPAPAKAKKANDPMAVKTKAVDARATKAKDVKAEKDDVVALENIRMGEIVKAEKPSAKAPENPEPSKAVPSKVVATVSQSAAAAQEAQKKITLTARAKKDSWLRVKCDGAVVFQSTLNKGSVETWLAREKIEISGKNINHLEFELNGKLIGALARRDFGAKNIIVTKDGLSVGK
jgi:cytoskeletal protein RodZ